MSQLLNVVYASAPNGEVIIATLELTNPDFPDGDLLTCTGFRNKTFTREDGTQAEFTASELGVALPKRDGSGQQNLTFAIENVTGIASRNVDAALAAGSNTKVILRLYISSDPSTPAEPPLRLNLVSAQFQGSTVQITAAFMDPINTAWPRKRYTIEFAPGLEFIGR